MVNSPLKSITIPNTRGELKLPFVTRGKLKIPTTCGFTTLGELKLPFVTRGEFIIPTPPPEGISVVLDCGIFRIKPTLCTLRIYHTFCVPWGCIAISTSIKHASMYVAKVDVLFYG